MYKLIGADGNEYGPISADIVRQWIAEGRANGLTRVLPENATEWKLLQDLPEFAAWLPPKTTPGTPAPFPVAAGQARRTNPLAITGMILGIISVTFGLCCCSGFPFSVSGLICSFIALSQINKDPLQNGRGLAITGIVLSSLSIVLGVIVSVIYGIFASMPDAIRRIQNL